MSVKIGVGIDEKQVIASSKLVEQGSDLLPRTEPIFSRRPTGTVVFVALPSAIGFVDSPRRRIGMILATDHVLNDFDFHGSP